MISKVIYEIKNNNESWSNQTISFAVENSNIKSVSITIEGTNCELVVDGNNEDDNLQYIILIWELLVWEDGYFYKPIEYSVCGMSKTIDNLVTIKCRITDEKWISSAILLCRNQRQISEEIIEKYRSIRYLDRKDNSMNASMFSSFFYLISESYSSINLEHRLVLLMHICDGFAIQFCKGSRKNNSGNINIILEKLDKIKYKQGATFLGISSSKAVNALGETRNELTHYTCKSDSLGSFIEDPNTVTDGMVNLYVFYVLEVAL